VIVNSLCGALVAYGLAGLRLTAHSLLINLVITALQSMISIQLQVTSKSRNMSEVPDNPDVILLCSKRFPN